MLRGIWGDPERYARHLLVPVRGPLLRRRRRQGRRGRLPVAARPRRRRDERLGPPHLDHRGRVRAGRPRGGRRGSRRRRDRPDHRPGDRRLRDRPRSATSRPTSCARRSASTSPPSSARSPDPGRSIIVPDLPKTRSGKIMRRLLRDVVEGRDPGRHHHARRRVGRAGHPRPGRRRRDRARTDMGWLVFARDHRGAAGRARDLRPHPDQALDPAQLPGRRAPAVHPRGVRPRAAPVHRHQQRRGAALQPRRATLDLHLGEGPRQHLRVRHRQHRRLDARLHHHQAGGVPRAAGAGRAERDRPVLRGAVREGARRSPRPSPRVAARRRSSTSPR